MMRGVGQPKHYLLPLAVIIGIVSQPVHADSPQSADKSQYTLWNPTPRDLMREMSTDRPDKTESAHTVDAGHFQVEMDLVSYAHDHDTLDGADVVADGIGIAIINMKVGLFNNTDLQLVLESYNRIRTEDRSAGITQIRSGFGDVTLRLKHTLWGNDEGRTALAMMPFVKFPSNQDDLGNDSIEGGVIFPFALTLPAGWGMGAMTEFDFIQAESGSGY